MSPKYQNDRIYFGKIKKECFHDEVGDAFFQFNVRKKYRWIHPTKLSINYTKKLHSLTKHLDSAYTILKFIYVLPKNNLKLKPKDLYDDYISYCEINRIQRIHNKSDFMIKLADVGMNYKKTNGNHWYRYSHEELKVISDKQKWVHELDYEECDAGKPPATPSRLEDKMTK